MSNIQPILDRARAGERLTSADCTALLESHDIARIGVAADEVRQRKHPSGMVTYIIDRNINYTNFCTEYCTFCAFYRPLKGKLATEGYILDFDTVYDKVRETVELGGTGVLLQGGLHPDLKIEWYEDLFRATLMDRLNRRQRAVAAAIVHETERGPRVSIHKCQQFGATKTALLVVAGDDYADVLHIAKFDSPGSFTPNRASCTDSRPSAAKNGCGPSNSPSGT